MRFAIQDDFLEISNLFKKNQKLFPHIRMGYLLRSIQQNECIYTDGVVIIFKIHQRTVRIGNKTKSLKSDCHLNQIVSTTRDGSASKILNQFFNYISLLPHASGVIYLNVRSENDRAKKFYERNGMKLIDRTSWSDGEIKGDVYQIIIEKDTPQNLERFTYGEKGYYKGISTKNTPSTSLEYNNISIQSNLIGDYQFYNIMLAICVGEFFGISDNNIKVAIEEYIPTNNRSEVVKTTRNTLILDAYNANPSSMKAMLISFAKQNYKNNTSEVKIPEACPILPHLLCCQCRLRRCRGVSSHEWFG